MPTFDQVVTGDKLLYHDKEFRKKIKGEMPSKTSDLANDDYTVKDAHYVHTDNNYTTDQVNKLSGIESGAEVNVIEKISLNGAVQTVKNKAVALTVNIPTVPTKVSAFSNDANYVSKTEMNTAINTAVANSGHLKRLKVDALPTTNIDTNTIYMVPRTKADGDNKLDEYMYINNAWEKVGASDVDLSGYAKSADFTEITNTQIDSIIATALTDSTT